MSILARGRVAAVLEMVAAEGQLVLRLDLLTSGALSRLRSGHNLEARYLPTVHRRSRESQASLE
jgi:hypothetical protein